WIGDRLGYDAVKVAPLMQLFLIAALPLILSVPAQMSIGMNNVKVIALASLAGSLVNLPLSCHLTAKLGVSGVIWGTVATTLFSNLLVPSFYIFRVLEIDPGVFLKRSLGAPLFGGTALVVSTWLLRTLMPVTYPGNALWSRSLPLILHLSVGSIAYLGGYLLVPSGRGDLIELADKLRRR